MKGFGFAAAAAAVCGLLVVAPAASAKSFLYTGPIDQPAADPSHQAPRAEFKVSFKKNKKGKQVPRSVKVFDAWNLWFQCEHPVPDSGDPSTIFYPGVLNEFAGTSKVTAGIEVPVKHGKFEAHDEDGGVTIRVYNAEIKGGEASGRVVITEFTEPGSGFDVGFCTSGELTWTASRGFRSG